MSAPIRQIELTALASRALVPVAVARAWCRSEPVDAASTGRLEAARAELDADPVGGLSLPDVGPLEPEYVDLPPRTAA